jgi:hypothetical protein
VAPRPDQRNTSLIGLKCGIRRDEKQHVKREQAEMLQLKGAMPLIFAIALDLRQGVVQHRERFFPPPHAGVGLGEQRGAVVAHRYSAPAPIFCRSLQSLRCLAQDSQFG